MVMFIWLIPIVYAPEFDKGNYNKGLYGRGQVFPIETVVAPVGGGSGGGSLLEGAILQVRCNQLAQQAKQCYTYNPASFSCEAGCGEEGFCNENYVCVGFRRTEQILVSLESILSPIENEVECLESEFIYYDSSCYECRGNLVNVQGTIMCEQPPPETKTTPIVAIVLVLMFIAITAFAIDDHYKKKIKKAKEKKKREEE